MPELADSIELTDLERAICSNFVTRRALIDTALRLAHAQAERGHAQINSEYASWLAALCARTGLDAKTLIAEYRIDAAGNCVRKSENKEQAKEAPACENKPD